MEKAVSLYEVAFKRSAENSVSQFMFAAHPSSLSESVFARVCVCLRIHQVACNEKSVCRLFFFFSLRLFIFRKSSVRMYLYTYIYVYIYICVCVFFFLTQ